MMQTESADRAREEAEDRAERNHVEPTEDDMAEALSTIADLLISGKTVDGWTMADIFDCWLDGTANREACKKIAECLNVFAENGSASAFWLNALEWQYELVKAHFPAEKVRERAEEMARDTLEDQR